MTAVKNNVDIFSTDVYNCIYFFFFTLRVFLFLLKFPLFPIYKMSCNKYTNLKNKCFIFVSVKSFLSSYSLF